MKQAAVVFLVVLTACAARQTEPPPLAPAATPAPAPPSPVPVSPAPSARPFDESLLTGKEFLLEPMSAVFVPRDIELGPLDSGPLAAAATALIQAAAKSDQPLDGATLAPRWAAYLQGWARRAKKEGLSGLVRAGVPVQQEDGYMVPVRVVGEKKEWRGWVFEVKDESGSGWLISDVQLLERDRDASLFDPESPLVPR